MYQRRNKAYFNLKEITMAKQKNPAFGETFVTGLCRAQFAKLATPDNGQYGQGKYTIDGIFEDQAMLQSTIEACHKHAKTIYGTIDGIKFPWKDGNAYTQYTGYAGNSYIRVRCSKMPGVVDKNNKPISGEEVYNGAYVRIKCTPYSYEKDEEVLVIEGKTQRKQKLKVKGITLILSAVQFVKDGERFHGGGGGFDNTYSDADSNSLTQEEEMPF